MNVFSRAKPAASGAGALAVLLALAPTAASQTLEDAITQALETSPAFAAQRARYDAVRQQFPQALSSALPQVSIIGTGQQSERDGSDEGESWSANATASQLVFSGGRVIHATRAARASIAEARADYGAATQDLILSVVAAYAGVREGEAALAAREASIRSLEEQVRFAEAQLEAGLATPTDLAQSRARLAQGRTQYAQAQAQYSAAVEAYLRLVGAPPFELSAPIPVTGLPESLQQALDRAGRANPALLAARAAADRADAVVGQTLSAHLPTINLTATRGVGSDAIDADEESTFESVGVRVTWPILTGGLNLSRGIEQRALRRAANYDLAEALRRVREQVTASWTGLQSARAAISSATEQVEAAEAAHAGMQSQYEAGIRSTLDLLAQEQDLRDARLARAGAERDLVVAERRMLAVIGALWTGAPHVATSEMQE